VAPSVLRLEDSPAGRACTASVRQGGVPTSASKPDMEAGLKDTLPAQNLLGLRTGHFWPTGVGSGSRGAPIAEIAVASMSREILRASASRFRVCTVFQMKWRHSQQISQLVQSGGSRQRVTCSE
jgi:hypothetical protein